MNSMYHALRARRLNISDFYDEEKEVLASRIYFPLGQTKRKTKRSEVPSRAT